MKPKIDFVVFVHRLYFGEKPKKGGLDFVIEYFIQQGLTGLIIESPLEYSQYNKVTCSLLNKDGQRTLSTVKTFTTNIFINWLLEFVYCVFFCFKYRASKALVITPDPLAALPALFLRKLGFFRFHYAHCIDYSEKRFSNNILNQVYRRMLLMGLNNADLVGVVTTRIIDKLKSLNVKTQMVHIPNSRDYHKLDAIRKTPSQRNRNLLVVTVAGVSNKFKLLELINLTEEIKKDFPEITLQIIGNTEPDKDYFVHLQKHIEEKQLQNNVKFLGFLDFEENSRVIANSYIGLAFYESSYSHVNYGDSLKIREYAVLGLPSVADTVTSTAEEMQKYNAGFAVSSFDEAKEKIKQLLQNLDLYTSISENALKWSMEKDKKLILDKTFSDLIKSHAN